MLSTSKKRICTTCRQNAEVFICRGCRQPFCAKHVGKHREKLAKDMNTMIGKCDRLRKDANLENFSRPLLSKIDKWEKESIEKIRKTANAVRNDIQKWFVETKAELETPLRQISDEMQKSKTTQDYTEINFQRWGEQLRELNEKLEQHPMIDYLEESTRSTNDKDIIYLLKTRDYRDRSRSFDTSGTLNLSEQNHEQVQEMDSLEREKFSEVLGSIVLSENDHIASYSGPWIGNASVSGINLYSTGTHHLHFRVMEKFYDSPFFGIINGSQKLSERIFDCQSMNGWKNFDFRVVNGIEEREGRDRIIRPGDDVTLTLDCERRQLLFKHHRTGRLLQLSIDIRLCPFPWKLLIVLRRRGDSVRLLGGTVSFMTLDLLSRLSERTQKSS